jgi:putative transcriptional regulator
VPRSFRAGRCTRHLIELGGLVIHLARRVAAAQVTMLTAGEIRTLREESNLSQAVFAKILNVTVGYVARLERGIKHPKGSALALLNVIRRKGIEAVL